MVKVGLPGWSLWKGQGGGIVEMLFIPEDEVVARRHIITPTVIPGKAGNPGWQLIPVFETVAKGPGKKGTTKNTKSTKKSFSLP